MLKGELAHQGSHVRAVRALRWRLLGTGVGRPRLGRLVGGRRLVSGGRLVARLRAGLTARLLIAAWLIRRLLLGLGARLLVAGLLVALLLGGRRLERGGLIRRLVGGTRLVVRLLATGVLVTRPGGGGRGSGLAVAPGGGRCAVGGRGTVGGRTAVGRRTAVGGRRGRAGRGGRSAVGGALLVDHGELGTDLDRLVLGDGDAAQDARHRRRDLGVHLVRGDLEERLVRLDVLSLPLQPARDSSLGDALAELWHGYGDRHGFRAPSLSRQ